MEFKRIFVCGRKIRMNEVDVETIVSPTVIPFEEYALNRVAAIIGIFIMRKPTLMLFY